MYKFFSSAVVLVALFNVGHGQQLPEIGIATSIVNDNIVYQSGYRLIGEGVARMVSPRLSEEDFEKNKEKVKAAKCRVYMCNVFFPPDIKIAGKDVDDNKVLAHAKGVFERAGTLGIEAIVLGSGGARKIDDDVNREEAVAKFVVLGRKMADIAQRYNVKIFLENLNSTETNFMTSLTEAAQVVRKINHPNFRLNADIYHMLRENESPQSIIEAGDVISYVEVAEKEGRTRPGVNQENFVPYFKALKTIDYKGKVFIEGKWTDLAREAPLAKKYLEDQLRVAYAD